MPKQKPNKKKVVTQKKGAAKSVAGKGVQKKVVKKKSDNPNFEKRARNYGIGCDIQPKRDLTRFVRWPRYIKLQRQKRVLLKRLKVPPQINQFNRTIDKNTAHQLFNLLEKYSPETKPQKKARLLKIAKKTATEGEKSTTVSSPKPKVIKYGLNHVTALIEGRVAKLVLIAHDVDPLELVLWLPALCKKKGVPYLIVKGKARLGKVVHKKTASVLAVTNVEQKDMKDLSSLINKGEENYLKRFTDQMKIDGGGIMGNKHMNKAAKEEKRRKKEAKAKNQ